MTLRLFQFSITIGLHECNWTRGVNHRMVFDILISKH